MARKLYGRTGLTGGTSDDLDGIDGNDLNDGDICIVVGLDSTSVMARIYLLDADSGLSESSPNRIVPNSNPGSKVWIYQPSGGEVGPTGPQGESFPTDVMDEDEDNCLVIKNTHYFDAEYDNGNSDSTSTINWKLGNKQKITLNDNCTLSFTNPSGPCNLILKIIQDGTGSRTITWPVSIKWPDSVTPTLTTNPDAIDIISLYFDGTYYYGVGSFNFS